MENQLIQNIDAVNLNFVTHEPSFLQKCLQVYWVNPKSWLLKEFSVENGEIFIELLNGKEFSSPLAKCSFKYQKDNYDRVEFIVESENEKIHFKEIPGMLEDEEWEEITSFIIDTCNAKVSRLGSITNVLKSIKDIIGG